MQINKNSEIGKYLKENTPDLIEESIWSASKTDYALYVPMKSKGVLKKDIIGIKQLEIVKKIQMNWVENGTNLELCTKPFIRHNVSNTIEVDNWEEVRDYVWDNKQYFKGISFLSITGDRTFYQAPFTTVNSSETLISKYGDAAIFASGLIVDGLHAFDDLYSACNYVLNKDIELTGSREEIFMKQDWIRRVKKFTKSYFSSLDECISCLKDVYWLHKWNKINKKLSNFKFNFESLSKPEYTDIDTLGAIACNNGSCELI